MQKLNSYSIGLFIITVFLFASCDDSSLSSGETETPAGLSDQEIIAEEAFPDIAGDSVVINTAEGEIALEKKEDQYVFEGDILLTEEQIAFLKGEQVKDLDPEAKSTFRTNVNAKWPRRTVYYRISPNLPNKARVRNAIRHWRNRTNLQFVRRSNQRNFVFFRPGSGCSSYIGKIGGRQPINLTRGCSTGNIIHEIGHAVGLFHEQSRKDRNRYIRIRWRNIQRGRANNFRTYRSMGLRGNETGRLDFNSIMMYPSYAFSNGNGPTIVRRNGSTYRTQHSRLSNADLRGIRRLY